MTMANYWDEYEGAAKEESGGAGGIVGLATIETGFKVYVAGVTQEESFFAADARNKTARAAAKSASKKFGDEHGAARDAQWGIQIRVAKNSAFSGGKAATWKDDRFFNTDAWTSACKEVVIPALKQHELALPFTGWVRIGFKPDPYKEAQGEAGKTDSDMDGNPRFPLVAYVTDVFPNKAAAIEAVGTPADEGIPGIDDVNEYPKDWDANSYNEYIVAPVVAMHAEGKNVPQIIAAVEALGLGIPKLTPVQVLKMVG